MTVLPEKRRNPFENVGDPLFFVSLTNQHTFSGEIMSDSLGLGHFWAEKMGIRLDTRLHFLPVRSTVT